VLPTRLVVKHRSSRGHGNYVPCWIMGLKRELFMDVGIAMEMETRVTGHFHDQGCFPHIITDQLTIAV